MASDDSDLSFFALSEKYPDEASAIAYFTDARWPNGVHCPDCGSTSVYDCKARRRLPLHKCRDCGEQFTVTSGTVMESTKLPLRKWLWAFHMLGGAKRSLSSRYLARQLGITVRSAWHLTHRIRATMKNTEGKFTGIAEVDEAWHGGERKGYGRGFRGHRKAWQGIATRSHKDAKGRFIGEPGKLRTIVLDDAENVDGRTVGAKLRRYTIPAKTRLMTDESPIYNAIGKSFKSHDRVHHKSKDYAHVDPQTGRLITTNTIEGAFGNLKKQLHGTHNAVSHKHLHRYTSEYDYKYNTREQTDTERTEEAIGNMEGERVTLFKSESGAAGDALHDHKASEPGAVGTRRGWHNRKGKGRRFSE